MTAEQVIEVRNRLKGDENRPVRMHIADNITLIDESSALQFVVWDDADGYLTVFRLTDNQTDIYPNNVGKYLSVLTIDYEQIQGIEVPYLPVKNVSEIAQEFGADATKSNNVQKMFNTILGTDFATMSQTDIDKLMGIYALYGSDEEYKASNRARDDYYDGRYAESFKETRSTAMNNAYVDSLKKSSKDDETTDDDDKG